MPDNIRKGKVYNLDRSFNVSGSVIAEHLIINKSQKCAWSYSPNISDDQG